MWEIDGSKEVNFPFLVLLNLPLEPLTIGLDSKQWNINTKYYNKRAIILRNLSEKLFFFNFKRDKSVESFSLLFEAKKNYIYCLKWDDKEENFIKEVLNINTINKNVLEAVENKDKSDFVFVDFKEEDSLLWEECTKNWKEETLCSVFINLGEQMCPRYPTVPNVTHLLKQMRKKEKVSEKYSKLLERKGSALTALVFDSSDLLSVFVEVEFLNSFVSCLAAVELSFVLFVYSNCFQSLSFWLKVIDLLSNSDWFFTQNDTYLQSLLALLTAQITLFEIDEDSVRNGALNDTKVDKFLLRLGELDEKFKHFLKTKGFKSEEEESLVNEEERERAVDGNSLYINEIKASNSSTKYTKDGKQRRMSWMTGILE